jgi:ligand-binding sensor domain-containing protein
MLRFFGYFLLLQSFPVFGQILPFKNYSSKPELMDQQVTGLIKDDRGLLWIGTPFGLYWFTGS